MELFKIEVEKLAETRNGSCACACIPGVGGGTGQV